MTPAACRHGSRTALDLGNDDSQGRTWTARRGVADPHGARSFPVSAPAAPQGALTLPREGSRADQGADTAWQGADVARFHGSRA